MVCSNIMQIYRFFSRKNHILTPTIRIILVPKRLKQQIYKYLTPKKISTNNSTMLCSLSPNTSSNFATISCFFNPWEQRKEPRFAISLSSFPLSSSCSASQPDNSRSTWRTKSLKDAYSHDVKTDVHASEKFVQIRSKSVPSRPSWIIVFLKSKKIKSILLLNVITIIYASNISVVKDVEAFMDPAAFSAVRFIVSTIPLLPFVFGARNDVQTRNAGIELGLYISLGYLIEALGPVTSDAGRASFISLFTVTVVPLLESMLGAIMPARTWFGVLMSVLGVAMLECSGSPPSAGDLLNFLSAIFFGIHTLRTEQLSRITKTENFLPLLGYEADNRQKMLSKAAGLKSERRQIFLWIASFASFAVKVPMVPVHIWSPEAHVEAPTAGSVILAGIPLKEFVLLLFLSTIWYLIGGCFDNAQDSDEMYWTWSAMWDWVVAFPWIQAIYTGVFSTGLCLWAEIAAMRDVSATEAAIIYGLEPLWGAGFAWFLLGERWGTAGWIGAAFVLGGSLIVQILGSSYCESTEAEDYDKKDEFLVVSNRQKPQTNLSTSLVVVHSRKNLY